MMVATAVMYLFGLFHYNFFSAVPIATETVYRFSDDAIAQLESAYSSSPVQNQKTGSSNWPVIHWTLLFSGAAVGVVATRRRVKYRIRKG